MPFCSTGKSCGQKTHLIRETFTSQEFNKKMLLHSPSICAAAAASTTDSHYYPIKAAGARLSCTCHLANRSLARLSAALPGSGRGRVEFGSGATARKKTKKTL